MSNEHILSMENREINLWTMSLDVSEAELENIWTVLSPAERDRAARYRFPAPARRFVVARGRLRELLGLYLGVAPGLVRLDVNPWGKPRLAGPGNLHFNLAHSEDLAVYTFAQNRPLGVDIEKVRPLDNLDGMVSRSFSLAEQEAFRGLPPEKRLAAFFATWTRKEAYMKARGLGFHLSPQTFDVTVSPAGPPQILEDAHDSGTSENWACYDLEIGKGFTGAVVVARD